MGTILNAKLSLLITTGSPSPSIPFYHPISLLLSLTLSHTFRSKPRFIGSNDPWRPDEGRSTTSPLPPFFHTRERFGVNRNRISRERRLQAIREVFTPSCEGTSIRERGGGSTIEGRKGHGSRNLSSVAQHCCHGRFALSAGRIDGGAECCWVRSLFLDACIAVQAGDSPARQCA